MNLTTPMKILLVVIIVALVGVSFYLMDWQKKLANLKELQLTLDNKNQELERNQKMVEKLPELYKESDELQGELERLLIANIKPEPEWAFVSNYLKEIEKLVIYERQRMNDPSFSIQSITPGVMVSPTAAKGDEKKPEGAAAEPAKKEETTSSTPSALTQFPTRKFQMTLQGRYGTLVDFLQQLGALKLRRLVTIDRISLSPAEVKGGKSPVLNITIPITAYLSKGGVGQ
jgi:Tfp pilus assembly protein PilO